jgi:radical SAM protein with 4Fe4S-binding SPASM domain
MKIFKPEWIKWRCHKNESGTKSLVYQLLEGENYLFDDISADFVKKLLDNKAWSEIDLEGLFKHFPDIPKADLNSFLDELIDNGILMDFIPTYDEIKQMRRKVGDYRIKIQKSRDLHSEKETKKKLPFFQSDPESDYAAFLEADRIPSVVMFELTYNCNEMCVHCFNPGAARNKEEKSLRNKREEINIDHYKELLKDLDEMGVYKIILTGGDPFVKPKIWELIELISRTNIVFDIYTNGLGLLGRVEKLSKFWPLSMGLSIYSGDHEVHNSITRVPNSLKKSLIVADDAAKLGIPLYFKCPIMTHNATSYYKVAEIAKNYGAIPQMDVSLTDAIDGDVTITENLQVKDDLLEIILRDPDIPIYVGKEAPDFGRQVKNKEEAFCGAGTVMMNITPEGDVTPCNSFPTQFGNLKSKSFKDIIQNSDDLRKWQGIAIKDYDECGTHERCNYCSRCPGQSFIEHGTPLKASSANCNMAIARMNLANMMRNGKDPLRGKSVAQVLDNYEDKIPEKIISNKSINHRNKKLKL